MGCLKRVTQFSEKYAARLKESFTYQCRRRKHTIEEKIELTYESQTKLAVEIQKIIKHGTTTIPLY